MEPNIKIIKIEKYFLIHKNPLLRKPSTFEGSRTIMNEYHWESFLGKNLKRRASVVVASN